MKFYEYPILSNVGVVGCAYLYFKEDPQENYLENLTYVPEAYKEQRLEKYKDKSLWLIVCS